MDVDILSQQVQAMRRRIGGVFQEARQYDDPNCEVLHKALEELQLALDQLFLAEDVLRRKHDELAAARDAQDQERQRGQDTFNSVPVAYIVTGLDGTIRRVNSAAVEFFNQTEKFLVGKSLGIFIPEGERRAFRSELDRLRSLQQPEDRVMRVQPQGSRPLDVALTVGVARDRAGRVVAIHWLLRQFNAGRRGERDAARRVERYVQA